MLQAISQSPAIFVSVGSKKIQQDLARPGAVEHFLNAEKSKHIRNSFVGLYSLKEVNYF